MSVQQEKFKEIADAIRGKTNSTDKIKPSEFASKVNEVYEAGVKSVVIEGEKLGEVVTMTDVSPYEHEMSVKVRKKNYCDLSSLVGKPVTQSGVTFSCGEDGGVTASGNATGYAAIGPVNLYLPISTYTFSVTGDFSNMACQFTITSEAGANLWTQNPTTSGKSYTVNLADYPAYNRVQVSFKRNNNGAVSGTMYAQIEEVLDISTVNVIVSTEDGQIATYPANADGTVEGVTSHYPTTILSADKSGVILDCTYNRDADKVVEVCTEEGKKSEHDRFWDDYQDYGNRTVYANAFGACWTVNNFRPKYPMRPTNAYMMFFTNVSAGIEIDDFVAFCEENNVVLDFSQCTNVMYGLATLHTWHHGVLDFSKATTMNYLFYSHNSSARSITTIDEWISSETTTYHSSTFEGATNLTSFKVSGVIAKNVDFSKCTKLTHDSLMSVINHLKDGVSGLTLTLGSTNLAKLTDAEKAIATQKGWSLA